MSRLGRLSVLAAAAIVCTASFAATTTIELVDRFGDPVTGTELVAIVGGEKIMLGSNSSGIFEIDAEPGSSIIIVPVNSADFGDVQFSIPSGTGGLNTVMLPASVRAQHTCPEAAGVAIGSTTAFDTTGAGMDPILAGNDCGTDLGDGAFDGLWFSVVGDGSRLVASTCGQAAYDTKIGVFCGDCDPAGLTCIDGNDDGGGCAGFTSEIEWDTQAGATYLLYVTGFLGASGAGELTVDTVGANAGTPVDCLQIPMGACCEGDTCRIATVDDCDAAGGTYLGDDSECDSNVSTGDYVATPGTPIPDAGGGPISHTINVPDDFVIGDLNVDFITDHTWASDLTITITSPAPTSVTLAVGGFGPGSVCEGNVGADVIFDDQGPTDFDDSADCPPVLAGPVLGDGPGPAGGLLSDFNGENAAGPWIITVTDENNLDTGALLQWSLHFSDLISNCSGACCTDEPGVASDCVETSPQECAAGNGLFVGGSCADIVDCLPLYVEFDSVTATQTRDGVVVEWVTSTEIDTVAFRVLRESGGRTKALGTVANVAAAGHGLQGGSYVVVDREAGDAVRYYIEDISITGKVTRHGPFMVDRYSRGVRER